MFKQLKSRLQRLQRNPAETDTIRVVAHGMVGVGTLYRLARIVMFLGRPLTPLDLGIIGTAIVFEALRTEICVRLLTR